MPQVRVCAKKYRRLARCKSAFKLLFLFLVDEVVYGSQGYRLSQERTIDGVAAGFLALQICSGVSS